MKAPTKSTDTAHWQGFPLVDVVRKTYSEDVKPNSYFGPAGGGAAILSRLHKQDSDAPLRVGIVGLGAGSLAAWGRTGDFYRFYEINPQVVDVALDDRYFYYLTGSKADVDIVVGDARKILEAEEKAGFPGWDVLFIDAYSGDSIPLHLATKEAFELYRRRLAEDGLLVVQMSNWHINLLPLVKAVAERTGMALRGVESMSHGDFHNSAWAFLAEEDFTLVRDEQHGYEIDWEKVIPMAHPPMDHRGNLVSLVMYNMKGHIPRKHPKFNDKDVLKRFGF